MAAFQFGKRMNIDFKRNKFLTEKLLVLDGLTGTGKTMMARLVAAVLRQLGMLTRGHLVEVQRADLVGSHIGETALKTRQKIKEAENLIFDLQMDLDEIILERKK